MQNQKEINELSDRCLDDEGFIDTHIFHRQLKKRGLHPLYWENTQDLYEVLKAVCKMAGLKIMKDPSTDGMQGEGIIIGKK